MATVDLSGLQRGQMVMPVTAAQTTSILDGATDHEGVVAVAMRAVTVRKIGLWVDALTGVSPTYRVGLESQADGGSSGIPSGTYLGAGALGRADSTLGLGYNELTLGADVALVEGEAFALTVRYQLGTIDASNFVELNRTMSNDSAINNPCGYVNTTGTYSYTTGMVSKTLIDTAGNPLEDFGGASDLANQAWNSGSSPLLRGTGLVIPAGIDLECVGIKATVRPGATGTFRYVLWRGTEGTAVATTASVDTDVAMNSVPCAPYQLGLTPTWLLGGETWRFLIEPTNVTSIGNFQRLDFTNAAQRIAAAGSFFWTTGAAGVWTDDLAKTVGIVPVIRNVRYRSERPGFSHG